MDKARRTGRTQRTIDELIEYLQKDPEHKALYYTHTGRYGRSVIRERVPEVLHSRIRVISIGQQPPRGLDYREREFADHFYVEMARRRRTARIEARLGLIRELEFFFEVPA